MSEDKSYLLDTNVFRYYANRGSSARIQPFWDKVQSDNSYTLLICDETKRELTVQAANSALAAEMERIEQELFQLVEEVEYEGDIEVEHDLRLLAAHVKYKSYDVKVPTGYNSKDPDGYVAVEYPAVSDARIILSAIANTSGIVTSNLKEFAVLKVFGYDVWDPVTDKHVEIGEDVMKEMEQDTYLTDLTNKILQRFTSSYI